MVNKAVRMQGKQRQLVTDQMGWRWQKTEPDDSLGLGTLNSENSGNCHNAGNRWIQFADNEFEISFGHFQQAGGYTGNMRD